MGKRSGGKKGKGAEGARPKTPCRDDGAGSVVVHDIPSNSVAVGNPARVIKALPALDDERGSQKKA